VVPAINAKILMAETGKNRGEELKRAPSGKDRSHTDCALLAKIGAIQRAYVVAHRIEDEPLTAGSKGRQSVYAQAL